MNRTATDRIPTPSSARPVAPSKGALRPVGLGELSIRSGFWADRQHLNATAILEHAESWMEREGWIGNFDAAAEGRLPADRRGREFSDSEVYKLMEAMAWEIGRTGDARLEERFGALVARIAPVQEPDGYLSTVFGRPGQPPRYSDLEWGHELYCFGFILQVAVARLRTTGEDELVAIARRAADHVCEVFGPDGLQGVGGHAEIELALVELGRATGEQRYLDQARLFVERRGHGTLAPIVFGQAYFQDDVPVRDAEVLRGHAVRALYLAAGAVDVAVETGDDELLAAVERQVAATVARRTYLTGGMGSRHEGESFGEDFELAPDRSYSETCGGVAAAMLGHRLLLATGKAAHADLIERVLYNVVATSVAEDGRGFFYTNTLHQRVRGDVPPEDEASPHAATSLRAPWREVSCCPTNVARLLASLEAYVATVDDAGLQLHQFADADIRTALPGGAPVAVRMRTRYPDAGRVEVEVLETSEVPWTLSLRVPGWAEVGASLEVDGERSAVAPGYAQITRAFSAGETVALELPVRARWTWADPRVDAVRGQVAVERGPIVMCLESPDLADGADVDSARIHVDGDPIERDGQVLVHLRTQEFEDRGWPYGPGQPELADGQRLVPLTPYHGRANRGLATMRVWMPTTAG